jgi:hypothetical protein
MPLQTVAHNDDHQQAKKKAERAAQFEAKLIAGYAALVGSTANATSLVKGLHNDTLITLSSPGTPGTPGTPGRDAIPGSPAVPAVDCGSTRPIPGCVPQAEIPAVPEQPAIPAIPAVPAIPGEEVSFNSPTKALKYKEVSIVLWFMHAKLVEMDKSMTAAKPTQVKEALIGDTGILTMRAKHMSWHQIARRQGFTFVKNEGDVMQGHGKQHDQDDDDDDD